MVTLNNWRGEILGSEETYMYEGTKVTGTNQNLI